MLEGLGSLGASGAGGWAVVVPGRVSAEVAVARPHLVKATRVEFGEAHKRMRLERGAVCVSRGVRCFLLPLFHEEFSAQDLELRVVAARGGAGVRLDQQVLGGDWEGRVAVGAKEKKHRVWEGVQGEVGPVFRGGSWLKPW